MIRSPIEVGNLARALWTFVREERRGIVHLGESKVSVYEFTRQLATQAGLNPSLIQPVSLRKRQGSGLIAPDTSLRTV